MPETPVVAQSVISFNDSGKHLMIPLSALYFDANGALKADRWPLYATYQATVDPLLTRLLKDGTLRKGSTPAARPSFVATAVTPGATGVLIEIEISNVVPNSATPANSTADFKVTETDTYAGTEVGKLKDVVGTTANGGKRPGLVFVSSAGAPELPAAGTYSMAAAAPGDPAKADIPKHSGGGTAFSLQTRANGADAVLTSVQIKDVDQANNKFTLVVKWTKTQSGQAMNGLGAALAYAVNVSAPAGGFLAPAPGKVVLTGGSDAVSLNAVKASATALAQ